jgi:CRP-like cAMP-binding protein
LCTHGKVLAKVPLFKSCNKAFLNQLTEKIKLRIYAPGDAVVTVGEEGDEMFVLNKGQVDIENAEGKVLVTLGEGSVIGEVAFFSPNSKRTATVRAKTWCDFACLEKEDFMAVAAKFPEEMKTVESLAHARLTKDMLRKQIGDHPLFEGCNKDVLAAISEHFSPYQFYGEETLFSLGEPADALLFLGLGKLKISEIIRGTSAHHDRTTTKIISGGFFLDVVPFMNEGKRVSSCQAQGKASVMALDKTALDRVLFEHDAYDLVHANAHLLTRQDRLARAKNKFKRAMSRLKISQRLSKSAAESRKQRESDAAIKAVEPEETEQAAAAAAGADEDILVSFNESDFVEKLKAALTALNTIAKFKQGIGKK